MTANNRQHPAQRLERLANIFAGQRMPLHDFPFGRGQVRSLFQNLIRHRNFPQVMQISAPPQRHDRFLVQSEMPAQGDRVQRQPFAVSFGIGIAAFDAEPERADHRLRRFQFVGKFLEGEQGLQAGEHFFRENGLVEKIVRAGFDSPELALPVAETGDQNERDEPGGGIFFEFVAKLEAGFARHDHIRKHNVRSLTENLRLRLRHVGDRNHMVSPGRKQLLHDRPDFPIVVHHQHARTTPPERNFSHSFKRWRARKDRGSRFQGKSHARGPANR